MTQIAQVSSGIEVYTQHNELPSREVINFQDQYPTACGQDECPTALYQNKYPTAYNVNSPYHTAIKKAVMTRENGGLLEKLAGELKFIENTICGISRLMLWLGLVVRVLIIVVAVVEEMLGSRIRKESASKRCVFNYPPYLLQK